ncbi:uncharacterized protein LOC126688025 [Mercurialis annua]|uniref:uncharacterized protein LOC126688025 n=1 Tax=Mercurialis annua TaxID=3986 RepID=UPI002160D65D|nr:uncharacterized protein LOC126688025 [Mercurialis annua]
MARKNQSGVGRRAWNLLRLTLLWARKGGIFKRRLMAELPKFLKSLGHTTSMTTPRSLYHRQLSFDKTPIIHRPSSGSMRFKIPCITRQVDFDYDFDEVSREDDDGFMHFDNEEMGEGGDGCDDQERISEDEKGIDLRADEFIANFYRQMKLQRQISYLQYYNDTPKRSIS